MNHSTTDTVTGLRSWGLTPVRGRHPSRKSCDCSNCNPSVPMRGRIDQKALRAQCARQGIKCPVRIRLNRALMGQDVQGEHGGRGPLAPDGRPLPGAEHVIDLNPLLGPAQANRTVLHELRHAEQREKVPHMAARYSRCEQDYGYYENPFEIDAEVAADHYLGSCRIVVE